MKAGIAGAGIMGRLLAFALYQAGWEVTLFDAGTLSVSDVASGLLTPITELEKNDRIIYDLGMDALRIHWPDWLAKLNSNIFFNHQGSVVVAHPRDQKELCFFLEKIQTRLSAVSVEAQGSSFPEAMLHQRCDQARLMQLEPQLGHFKEGLFFPTEGQIDCQAVLMTLKTWAEKTIVCHQATVQEVIPGQVVVDNHRMVFDMVFDCRGLGAQSIFKNLRGVRGEIIWLYAPSVSLTRPIRLMHPRYSLYIVPRPNHVYLVGASEIESQDYSPISVHTLLELLTAAYSVQTGFSEARLLNTFTHCRPTLSHHRPVIKYHDQLLAINGLYRHGYLIAPTLVAEILLWLQSGMTAVHYQTLWEQWI